MTVIQQRLLRFCFGVAFAFVFVLQPGIKAWPNLMPKKQPPKLNGKKKNNGVQKSSISAIQRRKRRVSGSKPAQQQFPLPPPAELGLTELVQEEVDGLPNGSQITATTTVQPNVWNTAASSLVGIAANLIPKDLEQPSDTAAKLVINQLPPQSIEINLQDVPIVGPALSGTYAKLKKPLPPNMEPSIQIASPDDKFGALRAAAERGNLQFALKGLFQSIVEIQLQPNQPGVAPLEIRSSLIPKWPFGRQRSDWYKVTNMGNGETYYFNSKTGESTLDKPIDL